MIIIWLCVTFRITDPTPSPSPPKTFRRRIVDHQHYQSYAPYFHPDNSRLSPSPPAPYHMQNHPYPILGTSLVNGLHPTHASLFSILDYGYTQSRYHMIQFISPHVYSFHHMLVSYYHVVLCIWYSFFYVLVAILQTFMFQLLLFKTSSTCLVLVSFESQLSFPSFLTSLQKYILSVWN